MRLIYLKSRKDKLRYVKFMSARYKQSRYARDVMSQQLESFILGKSCFCEQAEVIPVAVVDDGDNLLCAATIIIADKMSDLLQLSFVEMIDDAFLAFPLILREARLKAMEIGAKKIVAGLNGHVNYGMGFLVDYFQENQSFGSPFNSETYIDVLTGCGGTPEYQVSFLIDIPEFHERWLSKLTGRSSSKVTYRIADFGNLEKEVGIYTDLNNEIFKTHPLYFERSYGEDMELLKEFSWLIKGENFIVAEYEGKPVGFLLWYPDFNELIKSGDSLGIKTVIKNRLFGKNINKFKIVEIGILPEFQGKNVSWGLLQKCSDLTRNRYKTCETGWIFDENKRSRGLAETWEGSFGESIELYKKYCVFYFDVTGDC